MARYIEKIKEKARHDGYVETLFGRRRQLLDIYSTIPQVQAQAERMAINHPIQGTAADLMKMAMIRVYDFMHHNLKESEAKILLQVHDELVCEVKEKLIAQITPELKKIMESVYQLDIPLIVDIKCGNNWQEIEPINHINREENL